MLHSNAALQSQNALLAFKIIYKFRYNRNSFYKNDVLNSWIFCSKMTCQIYMVCSIHKDQTRIWQVMCPDIINYIFLTFMLLTFWPKFKFSFVFSIFNFRAKIHTNKQMNERINKQMPKELKQRIEDYFQTSWSLNHGIDIYEVSNFFFFFSFNHNLYTPLHLSMAATILYCVCVCVRKLIMHSNFVCPLLNDIWIMCQRDWTKLHHLKISTFFISVMRFFFFIFSRSCHECCCTFYCFHYNGAASVMTLCWRN